MPKTPQNFTAADGVSLKEHIECRLIAIEKASELERETMNIRLESMNEFRDAMKDQAGTYITRTEYEIYHNQLERTIAEMKDFISDHKGRASQSSVIFIGFISLIGLLLSLVDWFTHQ